MAHTPVQTETNYIFRILNSVRNSVGYIKRKRAIQLKKKFLGTRYSVSIEGLDKHIMRAFIGNQAVL